MIPVETQRVSLGGGIYPFPWLSWTKMLLTKQVFPELARLAELSG